MELTELLSQVRNEAVQFVTMRPPDSPFVTLDRRVIVTGPAALVRLSRMGDSAVLEALVALLKERERAWAAVVMLAAMTGRESKVVDAFAGTPGEWWEPLGKTAHDRWSVWLRETKEHLVWDPKDGMFVERR